MHGGPHPFLYPSSLSVSLEKVKYIEDGMVGLKKGALGVRYLSAEVIATRRFPNKRDSSAGDRDAVLVFQGNGD